MSDIQTAWANRHDGECENEEIRGINFMIIGYRCHCYRRWLEERLQRALLVKKHRV